MKRANFLNILLASVLLAGAVGCKKTPKNITTIPGGQRTGPSDSTGLNALPPRNGTTGTGLTFDRNNQTTTTEPLTTSEIPVGDENAAEDRLPLAEHTVYFDFDRSAIKTSEQPKLEQVATFLKSNPTVNLKIEGHCDERGTEEYNRALGERRAIAAREFLIQKHGVESGRITTVSFGEDKPVSLEKTEEAYARNRRDEFVILRAQ